MAFIDYSDNNPPRQGNAKKIYNAFKAAGFQVFDLHYNPNCWGNARENGWGTWACEIQRPGRPREMLFCGVYPIGVYIEQLAAPFNKYLVVDAELKGINFK